MGSVRLLVNVSNGNIAQRIDYDAWGNQVANLGSNITSLSFAGGLTDEHTGLVRFGARDYDPIEGRWTSKDPILFAGGQSNLYVYVYNNPINIYDISGLQGNVCSKNSTEDYKDALRRMEALLNQLIENNKNYEQIKKNEQTVAPYLWQPPTFWEGLDQAVPIMLDGGAIAALYAGQPILAGGFSFTSTAWTAKNEGFSGSTGVGVVTMIAGTYGPLSYPMAIVQIVYDVYSTKK
ncbi:MAG: RHS repeat-associated core domain-containing protein [Bacteroidetes bacterium]|nr:RHS repeat-associated core domain-containing protein [Bacteroidota bacterium]MBU1114205.1 RHS repeat-associated core domain-containing protein [Bacteroidota bacterium]MBU1797014.1 RHS repeat-associated core domain-containing protein [Bacteroidota bacterium]